MAIFISSAGAKSCGRRFSVVAKVFQSILQIRLKLEGIHALLYAAFSNTKILLFLDYT